MAVFLLALAVLGLFVLIRHPSVYKHEMCHRARIQVFTTCECKALRRVNVPSPLRPNALRTAANVSIKARVHMGATFKLNPSHFA